VQGTGANSGVFGGCATALHGSSLDGAPGHLLLQERVGRCKWAVNNMKAWVSYPFLVLPLLITPCRLGLPFVAELVASPSTSPDYLVRRHYYNCGKTVKEVCLLPVKPPPLPGSLVLNHASSSCCAYPPLGTGPNRLRDSHAAKIE